MSEVTQILSSLERGDPQAAEQLLPLVYDELRKLAADRLAHEKPGQTLQATALVHEAYLRLVTPASGAASARSDPSWHNRGHFFAAAAEAMRRILVDAARRKQRLRRGGDRQRVELADVAQLKTFDPATVLAVDESLAQLAAEDAAAAEVVKLHFFAGLTLDEVGEALAISRATVFRHWSYARAWLKLRLPDDRS